MSGQQSPRGGRRPMMQATATVVIAALVGFGAVYGMARSPDNAGVPAMAEVRIAQAKSEVPAGAPAAALPAGPGANPLSTGEMAAFVFKKSPEALPNLTFLDGTGRERTLSDWRGKVVLLNLWATWCIPCRKEMPGLDRLQGELGSETFEVVALGVDRGGVDGARKFLDGIKVSKLAVYSDPSVKATGLLKAIGMPATLLVDRQGREIGRLVGPAEWDTAEAKALIKAALASTGDK